MKNRWGSLLNGCPLSLLILDCDGVLTNGKLPRQFCIYDGMGINRLKGKGVKIIILSGADSADIKQRAEDLHIDGCFLGEKNKASIVKDLIYAFGFQRENIVYVGDDLNDLEAMNLCGVKIAPKNAVKEVRRIADYITKKEGGNGAVREICDRLFREL